MIFSKQFPQLHRGANVRFDLPPTALERWNPGIHAAAEDENDIGIFDVIGEDFWGEGVTVKRVSAALRRIGAKNPVTVNINSPGGDLFEGLAIYSALREHEGEVTVKVLSLAASAASIIAMGASPGRLLIARSGFEMIHNAWTLAMGNRHDLRDIAEFLEPLDRAMADIYTVRTGDDIDDVQSLMDAETWIGGRDAIDRGFADDYLPSDQIEADGSTADKRAAVKKLDIALAKAGLSRAERRKLLNEYKTSTPSAAGTGMPGAAGDDTRNAVELHAEPLPRIQFPLEDFRHET